MGFSKNEYSEGVKIHGLTKNFIFWLKALKISRFIEKNLFFHMVPTLKICLGRLVKVKIALCHSRPGSSLRHSRPGRRYSIIIPFFPCKIY